MRSRRSNPALLVAALATAVAALAGAGAGASAPKSAPPPSPIKALLGSVKGLSPAAREQKLYDLAKQEGTLVWYTSLDTLISKKVAAAFEAKYPGVKVDLFRTTSETLDARILGEASAGTPGADVIETNGPDMLIFQHKRNILVPYRTAPNAAAIPAKWRYDTWTADRVNNFVVSWNTNLVPAGQEPKSLAELADPRWKGKISMEASDFDWFATAYQYFEQQELAKLKRPKTAKLRAAQKAKVDRNLDTLFKSIAGNAQIVTGHITQANLLAAGQFSVAVSQYAHTLEALQIKKAPVSFRPFVNPIFSRPQGLAIAYRLRHPATALLFYDWQLGKEGGQQVLLDGGSQPARPDMPDPQLSGSVQIPVDLRPIVSHYKYWSDKYNAITKG